MPAPGHDTVPTEAIAAACAAAHTALARAVDHQQAIDSALGCLVETVGNDLLTSVYVLQHDRLWLMAQRGYDEVRDGFTLDQGVLGRAVRTGELQYVASVRDDPDFIAAMTGVRSELTVPLTFDRPALGALNLETRRLELQPSAVPPVVGLAGAIGERVRAMSSQFELDLSTVSRLFVYASSLRGVQPVAELAARSLGRLLDLDCVQVNLGHDGSRLASFWRRPVSRAEPLEPAVLRSISDGLGSVSSTYAVVDLKTALGDDEARRRGWLIWLPLHVGRETIGSLVGISARQITAESGRREAATLIAAHAAALLDAAQALERERRAATSDPLTGLLNRRGLDEALAVELERASRGGVLSVIIFDCDDLKAVNDRGGHELGDRALQLLARCLEQTRRSSDVGARIGGDEFALVLPGSDRASAQLAAERLRSRLTEHASEPLGLVTASFGVAAYPEDGHTPAELLRAADQAMFSAKRAGRNRTIAYVH